MFVAEAGLMHVCHGEPSDFTPLSEWMRQSTMFHMLQSIRFFKCYLHSKVAGFRPRARRSETGRRVCIRTERGGER